MNRIKTLFSMALIVAPMVSHAEESKPAPFEFHGYARLGAVGDLNPFKPATTEQGFGQFGLYTSRHVRNLNYVRMQTLANLNDGMKFNLEAQIDGDLPHQKGNWDGAAVNVRNAYFETPVADNAAKLWFGARRMEFEDVRLFDQTGILGETTLYGAGAEYRMADVGGITALGLKDRVVKDPTAPVPPPAGVTVETAPVKDTTLFQRFDVKLGDNAALRPTFIYTRTSGAKTETKTFEKASDNFKVGTVLSTWGDSGWNNSFVWMNTENAAGSNKTSDKDFTLGMATSGDFEGLKDLNLGLMYGAIVEYKMFKNAQPKYKVKDDALKAEGTGKSNTKVALGVQPVYYITDRLHGALDLNYSMTTKVWSWEPNPNVMLVTPIVRYAASKNAMGTPQIFASMTYGKYETKAKTDTKGKKVDTLLTTQAGMEVWF